MARNIVPGARAVSGHVRRGLSMASGRAARVNRCSSSRTLRRRPRRQTGRPDWRRRHIAPRKSRRAGTASCPRRRDLTHGPVRDAQLLRDPLVGPGRVLADQAQLGPALQVAENAIARVGEDGEADRLALSPLQHVAPGDADVRQRQRSIGASARTAIPRPHAQYAERSSAHRPTTERQSLRPSR